MVEDKTNKPPKWGPKVSIEPLHEREQHVLRAQPAEPSVTAAAPTDTPATTTQAPLPRLRRLDADAREVCSGHGRDGALG